MKFFTCSVFDILPFFHELPLSPSAAQMREFKFSSNFSFLHVPASTVKPKKNIDPEKIVWALFFLSPHSSDEK